MSKSPWKSPVPAGIGHSAKIFRPGRDVASVTDFIADRASVGTGVRVYRWPCGTVAVVTRDGKEDALLEATSTEHLLGTYARGARVIDVRADLALECSAV